MKKTMILLIAIICLCFSSCAPAEPDIVSSEESSSAPTSTSEPASSSDSPSSSEVSSKVTTSYNKPTSSAVKENSSNVGTSSLKAPTTSTNTSKPTSSKTTTSNKEITDPNDPNFDPYHKEGYVYVPGEGYLKIENSSPPIFEDAMDGENFEDIMNDPNNPQIGY